ncbi:MAG: hypothetical protein ACAH80_17925 [Alphaproteobacteria bacterium]
MSLNKLFPSYLGDEFEVIHRMLPSAQHAPSLGDNFAFIGTEKVAVDCRLYNEWPADISFASEIQRRMLYALYTKHHDGHLREKCLRVIIDFDDAWMPPFVFSLLGEYVIEIVSTINENKESLAGKKSYSAFIRGNPDFIELIESRCTSYWDCYHRHGIQKYKYKSKDEYLGIVCLDYLRKSATA